MQVTGGSTSIADALDKMRLAGAAAREVLVIAAGKQLGISADQLRTENGTLIAPAGSSLPYSELARVVSLIAPPADPTLKSQDERKRLGKNLPRPDRPGKATGTTAYAIDVRLHNTAFASVRLSPRLGKEMLSFDAEEALGMDGVIKLVDLGTGIAVIANNTWTAIQATEAVNIEWGPAPYP